MKKLITICLLLSMAATQQACLQATAEPAKEIVADYELISSDNAWKLQQDVKWKINTGWKPAGGVCVADKVFYQAMVRWGGIHNCQPFFLMMSDSI